MVLEPHEPQCLVLLVKLRLVRVVRRYQQIDGGAHLHVDVTYVPMDAVADSGTLRFNSDDADEELIIVSLSGSGAQAATPEIVVSTSSLAFGAILVGTETTLDISVQNFGSAPLVVSSVSLGTGTSSEFAISAPASFTLGPAGSRTVRITYAPSDTVSDSGTLRIQSNDPGDSLIVVPLSGNGTPVPLPKIAIDRSSLGFGDVLIGDSTSLRLSISNTGTAPLTVDSVRLGNGTSADYSITARPANGTVVGIGETTTVDVTFVPSSEGSKTGSLRIASDDADESLIVVPLSGNGTPVPLPEIAIDRSSLGFGDVLINDSASLRLFITNTGGAPLTVNSVRLGSGTSSDYSITARPGDGSSVGIGEFTAVDVTLVPSSEGSKIGSLRISSDDADESLIVVPLSGNGMVTPSDLSFTLAWDAPTTNEDGSPLQDLDGFRIYIGESSGNYSRSIETGNTTMHTVDSLAAGTYYVVVTAYDLESNESSESREIVVTVP